MLKPSEYFALALKAEIESQPRGYRTQIALKAGVNPNQVSDIVHGRAYGSEETRRALVLAMGWDYEEFLKYGESLHEGRSYEPPIQTPPPYDPTLYVSVPIFTDLKMVGVPGAQVNRPVINEESSVLLLFKPLFDEQIVRHNSLAAFKMPDNSMEPTIIRDGIVVIDTDRREPHDDKLYAIKVDDVGHHFTVRRVSYSKDIILVCDNRKLRPKRLEGIWEEVVLGRVITSWSYHSLDE